MKTTNIILRIEPELKRELKSIARAKGKSLSAWILEECLMQARGCIRKCAACGKILFDEREMVVSGTLISKCPVCGHENKFELE